MTFDVPERLGVSPLQQLPVDKPDAGITALVASGFDVTALTVAEFAAEGIVLRPRSPIDVTTGSERWMSHSAYAAVDPAGDAVDRSYARQAVREHLDRTGCLRGVELIRTFPCLGTYRFGDGRDWVQCDVCGDFLGLRPVPSLAGDADERESDRARAKWGDDDIPL